VIKFISKDSVEESMFKVAQDKLNLEQQETGGGNGMVNLINYVLSNFINTRTFFILYFQMMKNLIRKRWLNY